MAEFTDDQKAIIKAIQDVARSLGYAPPKAPSRDEFTSHPLGMTERRVLKPFPDGYNAAVRAAELTPNIGGKQSRIKDEQLLEEYGRVVRERGEIPTGPRFDLDGIYSRSVYTNRFGPWSSMPAKFRGFAEGRPEWADVVVLLPLTNKEGVPPTPAAIDGRGGEVAPPPHPRHARRDDRTTYGNPIDFRGLRHEPVNEQGVVFLFGMVANELGYMVEGVQQGYPDCEAKRQIAPGKWQRVQIEFEFLSNRFKHDPEGCDVIVCWRHNWAECPSRLEVVELESEIKKLGKSAD